MLLITALVQTMTMITFCAKAARSHLALAPFGAPPTLGRQLKARMSVCDYTLHLLAGQGSPYLQYDRQRNDEVRVGIVPADSLDSLDWPTAFLDGEVSASDGGGPGHVSGTGTLQMLVAQ